MTTHNFCARVDALMDELEEWVNARVGRGQVEVVTLLEDGFIAVVTQGRPAGVARSLRDLPEVYRADAQAGARVVAIWTENV